MSVQAARSFLDEIPNVAEYKILYTPVAVFGYIGYQRGFDLELSLPTWFFTPQTYVTTVLEIIILSTIIASLTVSLIEKGNSIERDFNSPRTPIQTASDIILFFGLVGIFMVLVLHIWSLYTIYTTNIYLESLIGLVLSLYQLLLVINGTCSYLADMLHSLLHVIIKSLVL